MQDKIILGLLMDGDKSSYELQKTMEKSTGYFYNASQGSIQPALKKLMNNRHVTFSETYQGERAKKVYQITEEGKEAFFQWASQAIELEKPRDPALVKMFFFHYVEPERKIELIGQYLQEIKSVIATMTMMKRMSLEQLEKIQESMDAGKIASRMATLQFGLDYYVFLNEWYENYFMQVKKEAGQDGAHERKNER
ncbi:helix-turn-helix transcriptional regulator [Paenibacillus harenae]|uniref:helix-turn-helix transcriptional regulator n=1 Tax=Paenibacillus harenae TaxID=306543 RepID=UPI00040F5837|nr:helix-turn-helix transcriptional regulator [Paenibacillus harenae]